MAFGVFEASSRTTEAHDTMNFPQSATTAFDESPLLTRDQAQGEFDEMTRECFEHIECSLERATGDLAMDIGSGNEVGEVLQAKLTSIVDELVRHSLRQCRSIQRY